MNPKPFQLMFRVSEITERQDIHGLGNSQPRANVCVNLDIQTAENILHAVTGVLSCQNQELISRRLMEVFPSNPTIAD